MREAAEKLAAIFPRERLDAAVLAWAETAPPRGVWSVALSGGADSVALLLLVWAHWPRRRRNLRALHFDHRLRGVESGGDARFCRQLCRQLGVKLIAGTWAGARAKASEAEARAARMSFFAKHAKVVWLGHQQDDIAETMLMRLARGSGAGGLAAPRPVQSLPKKRVHLRPLLTLKKAEIVRALGEVGVTWREDSSNAGSAYFRNRVRREVIPVWTAAAQRDAIGGAARSRLLLEEDDAALDQWLATIDPWVKPGVLDLERLADKPRAIVRRALHRWVEAQPQMGELSRQAFDTLLDAIVSDKRTRQSAGSAGFAVSNRKRLVFERTRKIRRNFQRSAN